MPYIIAQAKDSSAHGYPMLRTLFFEYPDDPTSWLIEDEYMFGSDLLVAPLIEEAFQEARTYQSVKAAQLKYETGSAPIVLSGNRAALKHALAEVMLNALQENPTEPKIRVRLKAESAANGCQGLEIEVQDNGAGFTAEAAQKAASPRR